ncbi:MAG: nucleoside deaminase [Verrucomicrobiales bacterium]
MKDETFMRQAIELARTGMTHGHGGPFGAVIVRENHVLGEGWNRVLIDHDPTAHAEIHAIRNACKSLGTHDLTGASIFTTGEPCPMCLGAIHWARIERIHFGFRIEEAARGGFDDLHFYQSFARPADHGLIPATPLLEKASSALIDDYLQLAHRQAY